MPFEKRLIEGFLVGFIVRFMKERVRYRNAKTVVECRKAANRLPANSYFAAMFKREEASRLREDFWTTFGRYMNPVPSSEGMKINWINYRTGIKDLYFRMDIHQKAAIISITMEHKDRGMQERCFNQFLEFKTLLHATLEEEWVWQLHGEVSEGKVISRIYKELPNVSVFNKGQWSDLISFFKPRMIALDSFWENARYSFEGLT